jgi:hypothetical protein
MREIGFLIGEEDSENRETKVGKENLTQPTK